MIDLEKMETGWYYSQEKHGTEICHWDSDHEMWDSIFGSDKVLAPVPTYEEWKEKIDENEQLKKWCEEFNALEVVKENQRLKELLKECRNRLDTYYSDLLKQIDEVLK